MKYYLVKVIQKDVKKDTNRHFIECLEDNRLVGYYVRDYMPAPILVYKQWKYFDKDKGNRSSNAWGNYDYYLKNEGVVEFIREFNNIEDVDKHIFTEDL